MFNPQQFGRMKTILNCHTEQQVAASLLQPLVEEAAACSGVFLEFSAPGEDLVITRGILFGADSKNLDAYTKHYYRHDPMVALQIAHASDQSNKEPVALDDIIDRRTLMTSEYYNRFLRTIGISDVLALVVPNCGPIGETYCLGLHRAVGQPSFGQADRIRLENLWPAAIAALRGLARTEAIASLYKLMEALEQDHGLGIAIFDLQLQLVHGNTLARKALALKQSSTYRANLRRIDLARRRLATENCSSVELDLMSHASPAHLRMIFDPHGPARLLLVIGGETAIRTAVQETCQELRLSSRETEICELIVRGYSNEKIAIVLTISPRTVENHLRMIFAKTRVGSRTQLIAKILRLN